MKKFFKKIFSSKKGFSLMEVVLAVTLMVLCSGSIMPAYVQSMQYVYRAQKLRTLASEVSKSMATQNYNGTERHYTIRTSIAVEKGTNEQQATTKHTFVSAKKTTGDGLGKNETDIWEMQIEYEDWK